MVASGQQDKEKRKLQCSLLMLGTGSGDVLTLDVAAGELMVEKLGKYVSLL